MDCDTVFTADYIKKRRTRNGKIQYLVKWKGCPSRLNTWEPEDNILDPGLVLEFEERLAQEYRSGRPGRRPRSLMTVKEMKNRRRTLLAKVKQHRYLAELATTGDAKSNTSTDDLKDLSEKDECDQDITCAKSKLDDVITAERDANGNIPSLTSQNNARLSTKKPSYLSLDSNTNDLLLQPVTGGIYQNVNSPLAGIVPSPTAVSSPKSATLPPPLTDRCPSVATANKVATSPLSPNSDITTWPGATRLPTPTNTIKQGKFALLRKYRNSLEERPKVCVTDVTVGDVTVAIHEGTSPKGFFRERNGAGGESDVFW